MMTTPLRGLVHGSSIELEAPLPHLEGKRVLVLLEPDELPLAAEEQRRAWQEWAERGAVGPIGDLARAATSSWVSFFAMRFPASFRATVPLEHHAVHLRDGRRGRILSVMIKQPERLDPKERAREKQFSRQEDARALASGEKSREELRRENGHFVFPNVRISARGSKPLE